MHAPGANNVGGWWGRRGAWWLRGALLVVVALLGLAVAGGAVGQSAVSLSVEPTDVGVGGKVRPGDWTGLRVTVDNPTADDRELVLQWLLRDGDGDVVVAQRRATINAQRAEVVWLYGALPIDTRSGDTWTVQAVDADDGEQVAALAVSPTQAAVVPTNVAMFGVMAGSNIGLNDYAAGNTQHEELSLVRGIGLADLPDRWFGMASLSAIVWTPQTGGDPADASIAPAVWEALREWVLRGGHLVIVLPAVGQTWTQSPIADLLPAGEGQLRRVDVQALPHPRLSAILPDDIDTLPLTVFPEDARPGTSVVVRTEPRDGEEPLVVTVRRGFGQVTMIGLELTAPLLRAASVPSGERRLWNDVFQWTPPVFTAARVEAESRPGDEDRPPTMRPAHRLTPMSLTGGLLQRVSMSGRVTLVLLAAMLVFAAYLLVAAGSFAFVRARGKPQHAWLAFVGVAALFSIVAWAGAWVARPGTLSARHVSFVDVDGDTGLARVRSFVSLLVPRFGVAEVALVGETDDAPDAVLTTFTPRDVLSSPGFDTRGSSFVDPQRYVLDDDAPGRLALPLRATTKRLLIDVLDATGSDAHGVPRLRVVEPVTLRADFAGPMGKLVHDLDVPLENVVLVYAPGEQYVGRSRTLVPPRAWRYEAPRTNATPGTTATPATPGTWARGEELVLDGVPARALSLAVPQRRYTDTAARAWQAEGWLGPLVGNLPGGLTADPLALGADPVQSALMLSFFNALPPPDFTAAVTLAPPGRAARPLAHNLDLSGLLAGPRLILLAQLPDSALPVGLTVDGRNPDSTGRTILRAVWDLGQPAGR